MVVGKPQITVEGGARDGEVVVANNADDGGSILSEPRWSRMGPPGSRPAYLAWGDRGTARCDDNEARGGGWHTPAPAADHGRSRP